MKLLTVQRGLPWGLAVSLVTTTVAGFLPFPGREVVPFEAWPLLAVVGTFAVCWQRSR